MKVILLQDIPKIGKAGDVKDVADGYAINFLLPRKMALAATTANIAMMEERKKKFASEILKKEKEEQTLFGKIAGRQVVIAKKVTDKNTLFAAVTAAEIGAALEKQLKVIVAPEKIVLPTHLKEVGDYSVEIKSRLGERAKLNIKIIPQEK